MEAKQGRLVKAPLAGADLVRPVGIICRRGKKLTPAAKQFLDFLLGKA
jgi:DNA-binding transcriptional LysR family regulator